MTAIEAHGANARIALRAARWPIVDAPAHVDPVPGLYAIHAPEDRWVELGLEYRADVPLYVGMAKSSLVARELGQHFAIDPEVPARTGGSTVRRSFAALLREPLQLRAVPRNLARPERPANYGLDPEGDARLTAWMHRSLTLAVWPMPAKLPLSQLEDVETHVIRAWTPPLNIRRNPVKLRRLTLARQVLADEARQWIVENRDTLVTLKSERHANEASPRRASRGRRDRPHRMRFGRRQRG